MSDLLKVKVGGSDYLCKWDPNFVVIGGRQYKTVKIGSQIWMAENLDYKFSYNGSDLPIGGSGNPTTPHAWYYNNDEATYGIDGTYKCGLLYNWYAAKYLDDNKSTLLPEGWHVPTRIEFDTLSTTIGGVSTAGTKLKALDNSVTSNWPSGWNGTDDYGFKALPVGFYIGDNDFGYLNEYSYFRAIDESSEYPENSYFTRLSSSQSVETFDGNKYYGMSLRLVKDAT